MDLGWGKVQNMDEIFRDLLFRKREMAADVPDLTGTIQPAEKKCINKPEVEIRTFFTYCI